jgi:hypothetical protein
MPGYQDLLKALRKRAQRYGIRLRSAKLGPDVAGKFDGPTVILNSEFEPKELAFYLAHALGSIAQWSTDFDHAKAVNDELHAAKAERPGKIERFVKALGRYLEFEERSSEHAVWLLGELDYGRAVPQYTTFFRADLAAMSEFHVTGHAPVWRDFYAEWKRRVAAGKQKIQPFRPRPIPEFRPLRIPTQEVLQEED